MKRTLIVVCIGCFCLSAMGQFFSKEEKAAKEKEKKAAMKSSLQEAEQKVIYIEFCHAQQEAHDKAARMHPVKIHHTPEQRESRTIKAEKTAAALMNPYREEIAKKHSISVEYLAEIVKTGKEQEWPDGIEAPPEEE
ncbi:MAG: hypothetical protein KJN98_06240 [Pontiella sp.]|nr:hypothetical protein [Pontiella sp.]